MFIQRFNHCLKEEKGQDKSGRAAGLQTFTLHSTNLQYTKKKKKRRKKSRKKKISTNPPATRLWGGGRNTNWSLYFLCRAVDKLAEESLPGEGKCCRIATGENPAHQSERPAQLNSSLITNGNLPVPQLAKAFQHERLTGVLRKALVVWFGGRHSRYSCIGSSGGLYIIQNWCVCVCVCSAECLVQSSAQQLRGV